MGSMITPQPGIMEIALYQGGKSEIAGRSDVLKLSSNENPLGPPPSAIAAITAAATETHRYPSTDHAGLRAAISDVYGLEADRLICGSKMALMSKEISIFYSCYGFI